MNPHHQLELEDAQKKLALFRKHLELIARCTGESKNIQKNEILSAVSELRTLIEWAAQQPNLEAESAILLVKLQELNQIRENLETKSSEVTKTPVFETPNDEVNAPLQNNECLPKDLADSDAIPTNSNANYSENDAEDESVSVDKDSLCDYSASTEDRNIANAGSPESIDDTNVEVIPNDDKSYDICNLDDSNTDKPMKVKEVTENREQTPLVNSENLQVHKIDKPENLELDSRPCEIKSPDLYRSEVIIIETDEDNKSVEWINDPKNSSEPLDVCMYAIRNLYESLRAKENELLKLSAMQSDQKQIEALQSVIIDFHKDITNLNSELEQSKKENVLLKEQVLELEEAENDARLEAQKLEQKLIFLQEKDSHSQAEISQLKQSFKKCAETLAEKERVEKELRSQMKYMETLIQKYEDQIKTMEATQNKTDSPAKCDTEIIVKPEMHSKGTQMYIFTESKINRAASISSNTNNGNSDISQSQVLETTEDSKEKTESIDSTNCSINLTSTHEPAHCSVQADIVNLENIENISPKELLKRLHKLIDEDVNLQQQIHYVDEINLAMWKKLQNLDSHIGECKRQNINETNHPVLTENDIKDSSKENIEIEMQTQDENIPKVTSSTSLDQNEHYIQERLNKLKEINASFEKELKNKEEFCKEKEKKYDEWMETEKKVINDLNRLTEEKNWITNQIQSLKKEIDTREKLISKLEDDISCVKNKNKEEISKIRIHQEEAARPLILKVSQMLLKEKEILKMISSFKLKENRSQGKSELEILKCNYIELQLELSQAREEMRKIEESFKKLQDKCADKHALEETKINQELERVRNENLRYNKMLKDLEQNEKDLINALEKQERYLHEVRENYKTTIEEAEEEHRCIETELESHLRLIEEGAAIATSVLKEERLKAEKELQENVEDLKAKEEIYKARIAELERDVMNLHKELHKMTADADEKIDDIQLQVKIPDENIEKNVEIPDENIERSIEIPDENIERSIEIPDKIVEKNVETSDETIENSIEIPDEIIEKNIENSDKTIENTIEIPDEVIEKNIGISDKTIESSIEIPEEIIEKNIEISDEVIEKSIEILSSKPEVSEITPRTLPRSAIDVNLKSQSETAKDRTLTSVKDGRSKNKDVKQRKVKEKATEENVDELRAQVRELQSHIEKISEDISEMPPVQTAKPITALSLNMQKEDIDYAEVDECCSESLRKQNSSKFSQKSHKNEYFPELKNASQNQKADKESTEDNDYDEVLPRPTNFHVVQQVGSDTLLVGWNYVNPSVLEGFEVYVDDEVHDRIYIPDRTKALISGLNLRKTVRLSIFALSRYGQLSEPAVLDFYPQLDHSTNYFDDEEDEYRDFEDPMNNNKRPYSMEW